MGPDGSCWGSSSKPCFAFWACLLNVTPSPEPRYQCQWKSHKCGVKRWSKITMAEAHNKKPKKLWISLSVWKTRRICASKLRFAQGIWEGFGKLISNERGVARKIREKNLRKKSSWNWRNLTRRSHPFSAVGLLETCPGKSACLLWQGLRLPHWVKRPPATFALENRRNICFLGVRWPANKP